MSSSAPIFVADSPGDAAAARRGSKLLQGLTARHALSPQGEQFLIKALDPFHDSELAPADIPDGRSQRTVIKEVNQSATITAPGVVPWDCHIALIPDLIRSISTTTGATSAGSLSFAHATPGYVDSLTTTNTVETGVAWQTETSGNDTFVYNSGNVSSLSPYTQITGRSRIIGAAFEVHNITEELYKNGSVTVYREGYGPEEDLIQIDQNEWYDRSGSFQVGAAFQLPFTRKASIPSTESEAVLIPGSRQWDAADGCLVVATLEDPDQTYHSWTTKPVVYTSPAVYPSTAAVTDAIVMVPSFYTTLDTAGTHVISPPSSVRQRFDTGLRQSGAYFTGLSAETKLKLNVKWLIACMPDVDDSLIALARPSGARDDLALEFYSRVAERLPPGVRVSDNSKGDWFRSVLGTVAKVAPMIGMGFGPKGAAVGAGLGVAAAAIAGPRAMQQQRQVQRQVDQAAQEIRQVQQELAAAPVIMAGPYRPKVSRKRKRAGKVNMAFAKKPKVK